MATRALGVAIGVVVGGGNIFRGVKVSESGIPRVTGDLMGMLATVMNALALETAIEQAGRAARTLSALAMPEVCETYERARALRHLDDGRMVLLAGGTGNPFFTTDTTAVLRAAELGARGGAQGDRRRRRLQRRPQEGQKGQALRPPDPPGGDRAQPQSDGRDRLRACPGKPYAYHRVLDPEQGRDRGGAAGARRRDARWLLRQSGIARSDANRLGWARFGKAVADLDRTAFKGVAMASATHDINDIKRRMQGAIATLKHELGGLRTGRASASLLDPVQVEAYGTHMPLNQLATVSVPEPRLLSVQVWDKSMVTPVTKAIQASNLGLNPSTDGQVIRLRIPELNEERRRELVKVAHKYAEAAKVAVRHVRRDGLEVLKKLEKDHQISEDDGKRSADQVQKATDEAIVEVDRTLAAKEKEILTV